MAKYKHYFKKIMPNVENLDSGHRIFVIFQMLHLYPPPIIFHNFIKYDTN